MEGSLMVDVVPDEQALAAKLGPETLFGRTVADRRTWLLLARPAAIMSGHLQSTEVLVNDPELIADPEHRLREIRAWLEGLLIADPAAAGATVRDARRRVRTWGKWQGWTDELMTFGVLSLGDGVAFAAETIKASPLSAGERAELHESIAALARLTGVDEEQIPAGPAELRAYLDGMLREHVGHRAIHDMAVRMSLPAPERVPEPVWSAGQASGRHVGRIVLGATLPDITRERYGIPWSTGDRAQWAAMSAGLRAFGWLPARVRLVRAARRRR